MHAGVKYVQFAEIIAGQGPADIATQVGSLDVKISNMQLAAWAHMCDPFPFTAMREVAYRNHGLKVRISANQRCAALRRAAPCCAVRSAAAKPAGPRRFAGTPGIPQNHTHIAECWIRRSCNLACCCMCGANSSI